MLLAGASDLLGTEDLEELKLLCQRTLDSAWAPLLDFKRHLNSIFAFKLASKRYLESTWPFKLAS